MKTYIVICKPMSNSLAAAQRFDPDLVAEFTGEYDDAGNEAYEIFTEHDIERLLDLEPGVIEYHLQEPVD